MSELEWDHSEVDERYRGIYHPCGVCDIEDECPSDISNTGEFCCWDIGKVARDWSEQYSRPMR